MAALHIEVLLFIIFFYSRIHGIISLTHHRDVAVLHALKNSWENTPANWNQSNDPCGLPWKGVKCNSNSRVIELNLNGHLDDGPYGGLKGKLGGVIGDLTELKTLDLSYNEYLIGALPPQLGNLNNLYYLFLRGCSFTGSIPDELGNLAQLSELDLSRNKLRGKIPPSLGKLSKLGWLDLSGNQLSGKLLVSTRKTPGLDLLLNLESLSLSGNELSGKIPRSLGKLSQLEWLDLSRNQFSGKLPVSTWRTPGLDLLLHAQGFFLSRNQFDGKIPNSIGLVQNLHTIWLNQNALSGKIPSTISNIINLHELNLAQNKVSGALPDLSKNVDLRVLDLSNNSFVAAEAPTWFSALPLLRILSVENGSLHGPVPTKLFDLPKIKQVNLRNNAFSGTLTIIGANNASKLLLVDLQNNQISSVRADLNFTSLIILKGNPFCAQGVRNTIGEVKRVLFIRC